MVTGVLYAGADFETIKVSLTDRQGKRLTGTTGVVELTKINYQTVDNDSGTDLTVSTSAAAKAAAAKAAAAKAAAAKAAAAKAAAAKAAAAKAAAAKAAAKAKAKN